MSSERKSRLARWSKRKAAARESRGGASPVIAEETTAVPAPVTPPSEESVPAAQESAQPAPDLDLPDVESLTAESDFSIFMKDGVPAELRRLALRRLWASDPMFNVIDEMVEYGEDYTNAATVVKGMKSAWEVGRGYARTGGEAEPDVTADAEPGPEAGGGAQGGAQDPDPAAAEQVSSNEPAPEDDGETKG